MQASQQQGRCATGACAWRPLFFASSADASIRFWPFIPPPGAPRSALAQGPDLARCVMEAPLHGSSTHKRSCTDQCMHALPHGSSTHQSCLLCSSAHSLPVALPYSPTACCAALLTCCLLHSPAHLLPVARLCSPAACCTALLTCYLLRSFAHLLPVAQPCSPASPHQHRLGGALAEQRGVITCLLQHSQRSQRRVSLVKGSTHLRKARPQA